MKLNCKYIDFAEWYNNKTNQQWIKCYEYE